MSRYTQQEVVVTIVSARAGAISKANDITTSVKFGEHHKCWLYIVSKCLIEMTRMVNRLALNKTTIMCNVVVKNLPFPLSQYK